MISLLRKRKTCLPVSAGTFYFVQSASCSAHMGHNTHDSWRAMHPEKEKTAEWAVKKPYRNHKPPSVLTRMGVTSGGSWYLTSIVYLSFYWFATFLRTCRHLALFRSFSSSLIALSAPMLYSQLGWLPVGFCDLVLVAFGFEFIVHWTHSFLWL